MGSIKAKTHLQKLGFSDTDKKSPQHDKIQTWVYRNIKTILEETFMKNNPHPYEVSVGKWEHTVIHESGNYKMVVGFVDIKVDIHGKFFIKDSKEHESLTKTLFIEIKTQIPSLGELIRQMRAYQAFGDRFTSYMVISPDDQFETILNEQGFWFYKYKDPNLLF